MEHKGIMNIFGTKHKHQAENMLQLDECMKNSHITDANTQSHLHYLNLQATRQTR